MGNNPQQPSQDRQAEEFLFDFEAASFNPQQQLEQQALTTPLSAPVPNDSSSSSLLHSNHARYRASRHEWRANPARHPAACQSEGCAGADVAQLRRASDDLQAYLMSAPVAPDAQLRHAWSSVAFVSLPSGVRNTTTPQPNVADRRQNNQLKCLLVRVCVRVMQIISLVPFFSRVCMRLVLCLCVCLCFGFVEVYSSHLEQ